MDKSTIECTFLHARARAVVFFLPAVERRGPPLGDLLPRRGLHQSSSRFTVSARSRRAPSRVRRGGSERAYDQRVQLVYITAGAGRFWSETSGDAQVGPGSVFFVFPGVRHAYRPDPEAGWTESWIGFDGPHARRLWDNGILEAEQPIFKKKTGLTPSEWRVRLGRESKKRPA
ncbi:MAG: AraC family ligand binding domain-containing protein [Spirochaetota bacterium]